MAEMLLHQAANSRGRSPLGELLILGLPTVAQQASYTVLQFTDTYMLSRVGATEATAAGNAGMLAYSIMGFGAGIVFLVNTLVSQAYGRKDDRACGPYLWQGIWVGLIYGTLTLLLLPIAHYPFELSRHEPRLAHLETTFLQIAIGGTCLKLAATAMGQFLIAINRPNVVMIATIASVLTNVFANYLLIFGYHGLPKLGVIGSAWGTNIAILVEVAIVAGVVFTRPIRTRFHTTAWRPQIERMKTLVKLGAPAGVQMVADVLAWTVFMMTVMGIYGTKAMAGSTYAFRFWILSFMPAFGIAAAVTTLVGRYIGEGRPDISEARAHLGFKVCAIYMTCCGIICFLFREQLIGLFSTDPEVIRIGAMVLTVAAVFQIFDAMFVVYSGALRGAGDTLVPAVALISLSWTIVVGGGYLLATQFNRLGPVAPWCAGIVYAVLLGFFLLQRFRRGKWKSLNLERKVDDAKVDSISPAIPVGADGA